MLPIISPRAQLRKPREANPYIPALTDPGHSYGVDPSASWPPIAPPKRSPRGGGTPRSERSGRSTPRIHDAQAQQRKWLEAQHDDAVNRLSRETLISEELEKELAATREGIHKIVAEGGGSRDTVMRAEQALLRRRAKLEKRVGAYAARQDEVERYNDKLVAAVNGLRKQSAPHRLALKQLKAAAEKLGAQVAQHKQLTHKALDERERSAELLRHLREEQAVEVGHFAEQLDALKARSDELDGQNRAAMTTLEEATEEAKRQQYIAMRDARVRQERLEVRHGYLGAQLSGLDRDFLQLEKIVGVKFRAAEANSLQQIINRFIEKESKVASLEKFWAQQDEQIQKLLAEKAKLDEEYLAIQLERGEPSGGAADGRASPSSVSFAKGGGGGAPPSAEEVEAELAGVCKAVEQLFSMAGCKGHASLLTKGCSSSTLDEYFSALDARLDVLEVRASQLRELTIQSRMVAARRPNEDLNNFISMKARLLEGPARSASPTEQLRKMLPSIADHSEDAHADGELHETRRRSTLKGVDRAKRDEMIDAWASKQAAMRRAMQAVPSIRDFYEPPPESPPRDRKVYAPADLR